MYFEGVDKCLVLNVAEIVWVSSILTRPPRHHHFNPSKHSVLFHMDLLGPPASSIIEEPLKFSNPDLGGKIKTITYYITHNV